jgi:putative molybdopterin biosynthesis protein
VTASISQGRADWGVTIESVAREAGLRFQPLQAEQYDLVVPVSRRARPAVALLRSLLDDPASQLREQLAQLGFARS